MGKGGSKIFNAPGITPGLEIWRIDFIKKVAKPINVKIKTYDELENNKCYIILHTKDQTELKGKWQIHIWCGGDAIDNEIKAANNLLTEFWNMFNQNAIQYREQRLLESKLFLSYFNETKDLAPEPQTINLKSRLCNIKPMFMVQKTPTCLNIISIALETIILQLIYLGLYAVHTKLINDYVPVLPYKELAYEYLPILKQYVPNSRNLEIIGLSSVYIWAAVSTLECLTKCCSPKKKCYCILGLLKKIISFGLVLVAVFLVQTGMIFEYGNDLVYKDSVLEILGVATFSLWILTFGMRKI